MSIVLANSGNEEPMLNGAAPRTTAFDKSDRFKTNAEIFKKRTSRDMNSAHSSPFLSKSGKLGTAGDHGVMKDSGKLFTTSIGSQIIQTNPNRKMDNSPIQ